MSTYQSIQHVTVAGIRDYLIQHRVDAGDSLVLNPQDFEHVFHEMKDQDSNIDLPLRILNVAIIRDASGDVPAGKIQIVKNEATIG